MSSLTTVQKSCLRAHKASLTCQQKGDKEAGLEEPVRYALVYEGAIQLLKEGGYRDAVSGVWREGAIRVSRHILSSRKGQATSLVWSDPAPGELEPLL